MPVRALHPYRVALRREVCGPCPDRLPGGGCGRPAVNPCTIHTNLGPLVEAVLEVGGSGYIADYEVAIRSKVCPDCRQDAAGGCDWRDSCGCKLDGMLLRVVEVIETVRDEMATSAG